MTIKWNQIHVAVYRNFLNFHDMQGPMSNWRSLFMWCHSFMRTWSLWQWRSCDVTILFVSGVCDIDEVVMSPFCAYLDSAWFNLIKFVDVYVSWIFWPEEVVMSSFFAYLDSVETDLVWRVSGRVTGGQDISVTWQHGITSSGIICKGQSESKTLFDSFSIFLSNHMDDFGWIRLFFKGTELTIFKVYKWTDRWLPNKIRPQKLTLTFRWNMIRLSKIIIENCSVSIKSSPLHVCRLIDWLIDWIVFYVLSAT